MTGNDDVLRRIQHGRSRSRQREKRQELTEIVDLYAQPSHPFLYFLVAERFAVDRVQRLVRLSLDCASNDRMWIDLTTFSGRRTLQLDFDARFVGAMLDEF